MISFYPGPSRIHDEIPDYVRDAAESGILSANHRSPAFVSLSKETIRLLRLKLGIPEDYTIFFTSSATECWEIIAQSLIRSRSTHIWNGAFGQKWYDYTARIRNAESWSFDVEQSTEIAVPDHLLGEVLCLTQNETSNGTQVRDGILSQIRQAHPETLIAIDATSSLGGVALTFENAARLIGFDRLIDTRGIEQGTQVMRFICCLR